jgi:hypothetical protein
MKKAEPEKKISEEKTQEDKKEPVKQIAQKDDQTASDSEVAAALGGLVESQDSTEFVHK